ncbi:MAG TPA: hypothetical protein VG148_09255 [Pyrinomonadaceae bacterium]|nr:hypothetical protein [Pyrinomonadaceae bacterium]
MNIYRSIICLAAFACFHLAGGGPAALDSRAASQERTGRLAPPPLSCPRDQTTSFTGRVFAYRRGAGRVSVSVRTDEETTEHFTLRYGRRGNPKRLFLLRGEAFTRRDWSLIETRPGKLRPGIRATVWACYDGDEPEAELIDWMP